MKIKPVLKRLVHAIAFLYSLALGHAAAATVYSDVRPAIDRVSAIRKALAQRDATAAATADDREQPIRSAQWFNFPNYWASFPNWPNWGNWMNWRNF